MKKIIFTIFVFALFPLSNLFSQSVYFSEGFETSDSITYPVGWYTRYQGGVPNDTLAQWTVRDSGTCVPGINCTATSKAYQSKKSMVVSWWMLDSTNISDAWLITKKFGALPTDAVLSFYACGGSLNYSDSLEILISPTGDTTLSSFILLQTINWPIGSVYGNFQNNVIDLSSYAGSTPRIAFRYYMDCTTMGFVVYLDKVEMLGTVGINPIGTNIPKTFALGQNYPNPFNPVTNIKFDLPRNSNVRLEVFDNLGRLVNLLHNGELRAGSYEYQFYAGNLPSGVYFYRITADNFVDTKRMMVLK